MSAILENLNQASGAVIAAVLNSLWQAAALAAAAWVAMRFTPRMNAATRHVVWWAVLAAILVLPAAPVILAKWQAVAEPAARLDVPAIPASAVATEPADGSVTHLAEADPTLSTPRPTPARSAGPAAPLELRAGQWPTWIAALWSAVLLVQLGRIVWSYGYLRTVKRRAHRASPELRRNFDAWMMSCGVHRPAVLLVSGDVVSPMAAGFRQPAVILPAPLLDQFQEPELDHVLLHELAHIARRDDWSNLYARIASAVLALHPVAAWVLRQIERDREIACDDWVVSMTGAARPYAASLARLFEVCIARRRMLLATGMAQRASHLGERIQMLLRRSREYTPKASMARVALSSTVLLACAIAGAYAPQWLAFAQEAPPAQAAPAAAQDPTPLPAPPTAAAQPAPEAPQSPAVAGTPRPNFAFAAPQTPSPAVAATLPESAAPAAMPSPALASTPAPPDARSFMQENVQNLVRLDAIRKALEAHGYNSRHPEMVRIQAQIAALQEAVNSAPAATPQPGPASTAAPKGSFLAALVAAGYGNLSVDEIINLKNAGVTPQFLSGISQAGWGKLPPQELIDLSRRGVNPEYIRKIKEAGIRDLTIQDVTDLATYGVRPETIKEIHALGFGPYTAKQIIQFAQYGMRVDLFRALKDAGLTNVTAADIVEAQTIGLSARDLREARQYGPNLTLKQITKLKMAGVL